MTYIYYRPQVRQAATVIIFTFLTCGIYYLFYTYKAQNDINLIRKEPNYASGSTAVVLSLVTCGIFNLYWIYRMYQRTDDYVGESHGTQKYKLLKIYVFAIIASFILSTFNSDLSTIMSIAILILSLLVVSELCNSVNAAITKYEREGDHQDNQHNYNSYDTYSNYQDTIDSDR